jgi:pSer/pThr/pTyr-binding forkhead associated (FHA) protein
MFPYSPAVKLKLVPEVSDSKAAPPVKVFRLRHQGRELRLPPGDVVLGRGAHCSYSLEDPLISRRHARLVVGTSEVELEDLESANGVFVNGERVKGRRQLVSGDRIQLGKQELVLTALGPDSPDIALFDRATRDTLRNPVADLRPPGRRPSDPVSSEATNRLDSFALLCGVVDKVLVLGRGAEAERMLSGHLLLIMTGLEHGQPPDDATAERAATYALKLAAATAKGEWFNFAVRLYHLLARPLPGLLVDELYRLSRIVTAIDLDLLRGYVDALTAAADRLGPADRFVLQRLQGLTRVAAAK